jgi:hypothetical protein
MDAHVFIEDCDCDIPALFLIAPRARTAILTFSSWSSSDIAGEDGPGTVEGGPCMVAVRGKDQLSMLL